VQLFQRFYNNGVSIRSEDKLFRNASIRSEGMKMFYQQVREIAKAGKWHLLLKVFIENVVKYVALNIGLKAHLITFLSKDKRSSSVENK
ncbi:MAG: hypothetical protein J7559_00080, partial [Cohnella sp.]|nr:hypothetical protein [Cohnella sp.]